uniref:Uncharacterized protein n=1 Tax=Babesia bovis TaxID=5865 RepID=A7AN00_BABBO|eukprot:XP_001611502.1 hypothetical protein [Babesia bovis T2Bo]
MTLTDIVIEIKDLLGLTDVEVPEETDILRGGQTLLRPLHQLIIGLCLASHFNNHRYFINGMDDIKLENEKLRVIIESLNGETQCHIHDALNILTYSTLEQLEYPRISKITLDEIQEPRELFLAFLFLISKQQWFDRLEKRCPIQWKFTNCIINSIVQELNDLNRQKYAEMIDNDALLEQLQSLWDNQNIGYDDKISFDTPSASNATLRQRKFACGMSYLHSKSLTPIVLKETKQHVPCDTMDNELSNFSAKVSKCMSSIRNAKSQQTWRHPLQNKGSCIEAKDCAAHKNSLLDDISKIISHTAKDLKAKAELFCRSKDAETFDSELLRIIIGQSQDQNIFNHLMDDIEQVVLNVDLQEKGKVANMVQHNRKSAANRKGVLNVDCNNSNSQINVVLTEIGQLSNFIVQMQSRLKRLAQSVEQGDIERLKSFTRLSENQKDYDKQAHKKLYEQVKTSHSSNIHTLGKPTPAEWVLICRKESFERHLSLLRMIKKSLENEIKRTYLFESGLKMVQMFNPDSTARTPTSNVHSARKCNRLDASYLTFAGGSIALVIVPKKIKENVNMLKSFIVEGIATDNFVEEEELKDNSAKRCAMDFLRQTNSNFSKYRSSLTASMFFKPISITLFVRQK